MKFCQLYKKQDGRYIWEANGSTVKHCKAIAKRMAEYCRAEYCITAPDGSWMKSDNTETTRMKWVMQ